MLSAKSEKFDFIRKIIASQTSSSVFKELSNIKMNGFSVLDMQTAGLASRINETGVSFLSNFSRSLDWGAVELSRFIDLDQGFLISTVSATDASGKRALINEIVHTLDEMQVSEEEILSELARMKAQFQGSFEDLEEQN